VSRFQTARSVAFTAGKLALAIGLVAYLIWHGHISWEPIRASLGHWQYSGLALLVLCLTPLCQLWRWQSLLRAGSLHVPTRDVFSYLMVSKFLNMALPGYFGGDMIRGFYVSRRAARATHDEDAAAANRGAARGTPAVLSSIVLDRMAGLLPLFALALVGSASAVSYQIPSRFLTLVAAFSAMGLLARRRSTGRPTASRSRRRCCCA
jgi:uncharacterized membrane protein YbhN (UPF0104 family)